LKSLDFERIRNQQVVSSILTVGTIFNDLARCRPAAPVTA
jgi:hypothetical protein